MLRSLRDLARRPIIWIITALLIIALVLVLVLVLNPPGIFAPPEDKDGTKPATPSKEQPADCPDVFAVVIPGTWESSADDDPANPNANPRSLLLGVSHALQERYPSDRVEVYTVPYVAQFQSPMNPADVTYSESRQQGEQRANDAIRKTYDRCPETKQLIMGFSQGAVIAGDIASNIGTGAGPIPKADADLVIGVALVADGRRVAGAGTHAGPNPPGEGAEVALALFGAVTAATNGIDLRGARPGGFGVLNDRVVDICAPGDLICDAPSVVNPLEAANKLLAASNNPVHGAYATTTYWQLNGKPATQWLVTWAEARIDEALAG